MTTTYIVFRNFNIVVNVIIQYPTPKTHFKLVGCYWAIIFKKLKEKLSPIYTIYERGVLEIFTKLPL